MPATLEVTTTRRTSSAAAASHGDPRRKGVHLPDSLGRVRADEAGAVEDRVAAPEGASQRRPVQHIGADRVDLDVAKACQAALVPVRDSHWADIGRKSGHVRADEPSSARYTDRHNFRVGNLFLRSYTRSPP